MIKKVFFAYQDVMFYVGQFANEYGKAGRFINETLILVTFLGVRGIKPPLWVIPLVYIGFLVIVSLIGFWLVKLKVPHYNNKLSNEVNPQMVEIIERLKAIEAKLK